VTTALLMWRDLGRADGRALSELFETVFLTLMFVGLVSGIGIAVAYRWGSSWAAITLSPWIISFLRARPSTTYILEMPSIVRLHVFCAFTAMAIAPMTRLSPVFVYALDAGLGFAGRSLRPITAVGDSAEVAMRNLSSRLWPEED
jgi:nitrate reductase gamma subunit